MPDFLFKRQKNVLHENTRRYALHQKRFGSPNNNEEDAISQPLDADRQLSKFRDESERAVITDCLLECFEERSQDEQILLWRYSFDEKFTLDAEEPGLYQNLFGTILDSIREIRNLFIPLQDEFTPITEDVRLKVFRLRKKIKKMFGGLHYKKKKC